MVIGIIGAMDSEIALLRDRLANESRATVARATIYTGTINSLDVALVKCGVGKVNAAACTQALIDHSGVSCIINTGVAGSLDERMNICDIVVSTDAVQHDMDATFVGYAPGQIPGTNTVAFSADETLRLCAKEAVELCDGAIKPYDGRIASGDAFIADAQKKEWIRNTFGASCCEMEGAAIAQVCALNNIPFVIMRAISDKADGSDYIDYPVFEDKAAHACAQAVEIMLQRWPKQ